MKKTLVIMCCVSWGFFHCLSLYANINVIMDIDRDYFGELKTAAFGQGYHLNLITEAEKIPGLDPHKDQLLVINNSYTSANIAVQTAKFLRSGGRIAWVFVGVYAPKAVDLNDVLGKRFGVMVERTLGESKAKYDGVDFLPIWKDLFIGLPKACNQHRHNSLVVGKKTEVKPIAQVQYKGNQINTSAILKRGQGEILFICVPVYHFGGSREDNKPFFLDTKVYENKEALDRFLKWLSGDVSLLEND